MRMHSQPTLQWNDTDGDGFGDEITGNGGDACPETTRQDRNV